ncbi:MAG: ABC transporter substrate-binding protein [Candidatus Magasanikbacteria bacterium]|nr:ABC transporter substrate-binding protein [Candidatus Magasanikbacteria bacterium]
MKHKKLVFAGILVLIIVATLIYANRGARSPLSRVDLDRPLIVGVVSWPGYAGGIVANGGFKENPESIYTKKYGLPVRFVLIEDIDARGKAFAKGGPDGVDVVWSTIDFWANELPNFVAGGINGKAFLHVDWSRGGDALVADTDIKRVEDLKGKKISLVQFTPSHWLLETALRSSQLTETEQQKIRDGLVFTQDVQTARAAFAAGQVNAAVLWEPDVKQALKKQSAHVLISTQDFPNIIADVMVAKQEFINAHPKAIEAFVRGWLDGVEEAKRNPDFAAQVLVENEPLFADLGIGTTKESLSWVYWPNLEDNARMFGLDGQPALFDSVFANASEVWKSLGMIEKPLDAVQAKDDSVIRKIYAK